jgi:hypothetical protein
LSYAYLDSLISINPLKDDNCQKLVDYLAGGLNYAINLHNLGNVVAVLQAVTIPMIGSNFIYAVDSTANLKVDGLIGFPGISGFLKIISILDATTIEVENINIDPVALIPAPIGSPLLSKVIAVRATRSYDAVDIDTTSFPMLKVFRQKATSDVSRTVKTDLVITYSMLMPNVEQLPGIMHWIDRQLIAMLSAWSSNDQACPFQILPDLTDKITSEYRIMVGDLQQPVYAYLRISLPAKEFS